MPSFRGATLIFLCFFAANLLAGPEVAIGTPSVVTAPGSRSGLASASDGRDFLVVWNDDRGTNSGNWRLLAARVTREGQVLDPFGITVTANPGSLPHVFFVGDAYVVLWARLNTIHAARIAPNGTIVTPPHQVAVGNPSTNRFAATNGETIVLIHNSPVRSHTIDVTVLDAETNRIAEHRLVSGSDSHPIRSGATIASNGDGYIALWSSLTPPKMWPDAVLDAVRLDASGTPLDPEPRSIGTGDGVQIAGNSSGYVILAREPGPRGSEVRTTRSLTPELTAGASRAVPLHMTLFSATLVAFPERILLFAYSFGGKFLEVHTVAADGVLGETQTIVTASAEFFSDFPAAASNGSELLVAWIRAENLSGDAQPHDRVVEAQVLDAASFAPKSGTLLLTKSANEQRHPAIAYGNGNQHLVVWSDRHGLWATRVENGVSLDGHGVQLAERKTWPASVVFDGEHYIVAWSWYPTGTPTPTAVFARFISPAGELDEPLQFDGSGPVALATSGPATLLVWGETAVKAVRLDRATRTASAPVTIPTVPSYTLDLTAAWNGTHFLVAWAETRFDELPMLHPFPRATPRIAGIRLTESLGLADAAPRILAQSQNLSMFSSLASDGRDWLLVWTSEHDLRARRIAADGTPQGDVAGVVIGAPPAAIPSVIWDGARYAVAWPVADHAATRPVHLAYVSPALNAATTIVAVPGHGYTYDDERVSLARAPGGIALAYSRPAWEPQFGGVDRVFMKTFARKMRAVR